MGRMKRMDDEVHANLIAARSAWIAHRKCMRKLRRAAEQAPAYAAFTFESTAEHLHRKALTDIYYFGVVSPQARHIQKLERIEDPKTEAARKATFYETYFHDRDKYEELAAQGFFNLPKEKEELLRKGPSLNFDEELGFTVASSQHATYGLARMLMSFAGEESRANGNAYYGRAICEIFLETVDQAPAVFAGAVQQRWPGNPRIRDRALESLVGWVGARLKLAPGWDLTMVLGEHAEDTPFKGAATFERLIGELPGAVAIEWVALAGDEPVARLASRVERQLISAGGESAKLQRKDRLDDKKPEAPLGAYDDDLEEFERRETLKQQLNALQRWVENARLSEQQMQVYELDMQLAHDTAAIARRLGIPKNQVLQVRKNYRDKISKARRADTV